ncbi:hypothetical protein KNCP2_12350 [Candidatus Rickettsia kedanie]|uniref:Uncharacterized protein n=1 Tax=Candidatus Rickettsia kedanie TaxID=3115352 RepID=A0ABP9TYA1_9RICK
MVIKIVMANQIPYTYHNIPLTSIISTLVGTILNNENLSTVSRPLVPRSIGLLKLHVFLVMENAYLNYACA